MRAIVTGAAGGIGLATARILYGYEHVHGLDIEWIDDGGNIDEIGGCNILWRQIDASNPDQVENFFSNLLGYPYALVNCAGAIENENAREFDPAAWESALRNNLTSAMVMSAAFAKYAKKGGAIVNVGSVNAEFSSNGRLGYAVAKGGLETLTRVLATQLAPNIRVNCVVLGAFDTRMNQDPRAGERCVLKRLGDPEEAAHAIKFLLSPEASYITGACLNVDGGYGLVRSK